MERRLKMFLTLGNDKGTFVKSESCLENWKVGYQSTDFIHINTFQHGASLGKFLEILWKVIQEAKTQEFGALWSFAYKGRQRPATSLGPWEVCSEIVSECDFI